MIPIPTMIPTLQSDMYVDAFHGNQESTLQTVPFKEFTLRAEPLLLVLWTITFQVHQFFRSLQPLGTYATATQSKRVEDNLSWVLDSMANVIVACNPELVVYLRATDVAGLRGIGGTTKLEEIGTHPPFHR